MIWLVSHIFSLQFVQCCRKVLTKAAETLFVKFEQFLICPVTGSIRWVSFVRIEERVSPAAAQTHSGEATNISRENKWTHTMHAWLQTSSMKEFEEL
jgi:hypothetical protein